MKFSKTAALLTASFMASAPVSTIWAAESANVQKPVYDDFNPNDVNGRVIIDLPDGVTAHVDITFSSPEGKALPYYSSDIDGAGEAASFDIEGHDNTDDDFRIYDLSITLTGGEYGRSCVVTDSFTIYDLNDNPKSFTDRQYNFTLDNEFAADPAELTNEVNFGGVAGDYTCIKDYTLHLGVKPGDVDGDGIITGSDATIVLIEYTSLSSGNEGRFTPYQFAAADVDNDGIITGSDATTILRWYTDLSSGSDQ